MLTSDLDLVLVSYFVIGVTVSIGYCILCTYRSLLKIRQTRWNLSKKDWNLTRVVSQLLSINFKVNIQLDPKRFVVKTGDVYGNAESTTKPRLTCVLIAHWNINQQPEMSLQTYSMYQVEVG